MIATIALAFLASVTPDAEFAANAWPIVHAARKRICDIDAAVKAESTAPKSSSWLVRSTQGRLQLAIAYCALLEKNDLKTRDAWVARARKTFGNDRPNDLHPGFALLLDSPSSGSAIWEGIRKTILKELVVEGGTDRWILNVPFAEGRLPGESYLVASPPYVIEVGTKNASHVVASKPIDIEVPLNRDDLRGLRLGSRLTDLLEPADGNARLRADGMRLLSMPPPFVKKWVDDHASIQERINNKQEPIVVTRAWEASIAYETRRGGMSRPAWASLVSEVRKAVAHRRQSLTLEHEGDRLTLRLVGRQVLLYEGMLGSYVMHHLGGEEADAELQSVGRDLLLASPDVGREIEQELVWDLVTISGGIYPSESKLDQPWNRDSARLVQESLLPFAPRNVLELHATPKAPLTRKRLDQFVAGLRTKTDGAQLVVVYVIGHGVTYGESDLMLKLADVASGAKSESKGLLRAEDLHRRLGILQRPFALFIDSCLPSTQVSELRSSLGFVVDKKSLSLDYAGPDALITNEASELGARMHAWGAQREYLSGTNIVVFGAKPGIYTPARPHPVAPFGPPVGPLAERLWRAAEHVRHGADDRRLVSALRLSVDVLRGTGEIATKGTISWSDFDTFQRALWPRTTKAKAKRLLKVPGLTSVGRAGPSSTLLLTWMDNEGWSFGYWRPSSKIPTTVRSGLHFPTVVGTLTTVYVHDASDHAWTRHEVADGVPRKAFDTIPGAQYIGAASADWGELLVMGENGDVSVHDPVWKLESNGFQSQAIAPGEDVEDLTLWPPPKYVVALEGHTDLVQLNGKSAQSVGDCGTRLAFLSPGAIALYGLASDGRFVCRFDFDWKAQKRPLPPMFGEGITLRDIHSFTVFEDSLLFGIGEEVWVVPLDAFAWNDE